MKIAVPYPFLETGQPRVQEALSLWQNKKDVVICCPVDMYDPFFEDYNYTILPRNSLNIGTKIPKCYIADMLKETIKLFPNEDWYGVGNSDCVPSGDLLADSKGRDVLIFHRTEIKEWDHINALPPEAEIERKIMRLRQEGISDKRIARKLNREGAAPLYGEEWHYKMVAEVCITQGMVFVQGQDMWLFRSDIVQHFIENYLEKRDPILGTGGFDPRITYWCMKEYNSVRILNKLFHKMHESEWSPDDIEFDHNGGNIPEEELLEFYEQDFLIFVAEQGYGPAIPSWLMINLKKKNPKVWDEIVEATKSNY